jgi:hypothetical protein
VPRLLGMFAAGRVINPTPRRSEFIGGMTMGLHENSVLDPHHGRVVNHDRRVPHHHLRRRHRRRGDLARRAGSARQPMGTKGTLDKLLPEL